MGGNISRVTDQIYLSAGEYEDGTLCEIFIDINKQGTLIRGLFNCLAIAVSLGLQYGVPLQTFVSFFSRESFEPSGPVYGHPKIKRASSIVDCIFRLLGKEYIDKDGFNDSDDFV